MDGFGAEARSPRSWLSRSLFNTTSLHTHRARSAGTPCASCSRMTRWTSHASGVCGLDEQREQGREGKGEEGGCPDLATHARMQPVSHAHTHSMRVSHTTGRGQHTREGEARTDTPHSTADLSCAYERSAHGLELSCLRATHTQHHAHTHAG